MVVRNWVVKVVVPPKTREAQGSDDNDGWNDDEESEVDKVSGDFDVNSDGNGDDEIEVEGDEKWRRRKIKAV
ncbi:hypothetical protein HN51_018093, partial [Arachis hypogaea]